MANDGQIVFEVQIDGKNAKMDLKEITRMIDAESKNWDKSAKESTDNISDSFSGMLKKVSAGLVSAKIGKALLDIGKAAVQAASDLQEVQNVVDVTFGDDANKIESWAKKAGDQFGLTETQAKKFASTMGAMLKSSGLAGTQITQVSTDLAGLAADMASFYNLDFDTAFQKIRSGISGETEPLKQLGINMSVANLNAYALKQGLSKTFEQMSQGEQVMLRYQYIMSATADAQGDFSRTSDSYANAMRKVETNIETLKTKLGETLLPMVNDVVIAINDMFDALQSTGTKTVLDDFAEIDLDTGTKIDQIHKVAEEANTLIDTLSLISGTDAGAALQSMANGANELDSTSPQTWSALATSLKKVDGLQNIFGTDNASGNIEALANALSGASVDASKADAWATFLGALSDNADAVSKLTGTSVEETKKWLDGLRESAEKLSPEDAESWNVLMSSLVKGLSADNPQGQQFVQALASEFLSLGKDSDVAVKGLTALGFTTDQITDKQTEWLKTCNELVKTIPGLSEIINTETGEVKGGINALTEYVNEWQRSQEKIALLKALNAKREALADKQATMYSLEISQGSARIAAERARQKLIDEFGVVFGDENNPFTITGFGRMEYQGTEHKAYVDAVKRMTDAEKEYTDNVTANASALQELADSEEYIERKFGDVEVAVEDVTTTTDEWSEATKEAAQNAVTAANEALVALDEYVSGIYDKTEKAVNSVVKGFSAIETPMMKNRKKVKDLEDSILKLDSTSKTYKEDLAKINDELAKQRGEQISAQSVGKNLQQQAQYMEDYLANLRKARELGLSADVLAALSDGSTESYDVLEQLAQASPEEVETINAAYKDVIDKKKELTDELTQQQLTVDETYQTLATKAQEAVAALDLEQSAKDNAGKTVQGVVDGITSHLPDVTDAVNAIMSEIDRLAGFGITVDVDAVGLSISKGNQSNRRMINNRNGEYDFIEAFGGGVDYVPFDMYARIHEGEKILNAQEAAVYRNLLNGGTAGVDLDALGGVMRDNVKPGGNVYLDGKVVGAVVSDRQGRSYKSLQRSGWQS